MNEDTAMQNNDRDVVADINYFPVTGEPISKASWKPRYLDDNNSFTRPMTIRDVRRADKVFELATNGFTFMHLPLGSRITSKDDEETIKRDYYPELEAIATKL
jgi:hypothetical protein